MRFVAGRGAAAKSHREAVAGRGAAEERLAGALQRIAIGKMLLAGGTLTELLLAVDTVTELLLAGDAVTELLLARALLQNSIGKQPAGQPAQKTRQRKGAAKSSGQRRAAGGRIK